MYREVLARTEAGVAGSAISLTPAPFSVPHRHRRRLAVREGRAPPHAGRAPAPPVVINPASARCYQEKHTVRGFMAGAMKKAGHAVESFKPAGGERTYRIK
jgi:hypothetical protein